MNEEMVRSGLMLTEPIPRNMTELRLKINRMNRRPVGGLRIKEVDHDRVPTNLEVHGLIAKGKAVGYYGSIAKHLLASTLPSDVRLLGLTDCIDRMIDGREAVLYVEPTLVPCIEEHINNLAKCYDTPIAVTRE